MNLYAKKKDYIPNVELFDRIPNYWYKMRPEWNPEFAKGSFVGSLFGWSDTPIRLGIPVEPGVPLGTTMVRHCMGD